MIFIIDNYDSFVYNLARYVNELGMTHQIKRNDQVSIRDIINANPSHIIISPGPCTPNEAGISLEVIRQLGGKIPILGVCLGHQAIGQAYGAEIIHAKNPTHGKASLIKHNEKNIFKGLKNPLQVGRYHSLAVGENRLPDCLRVTATSDDGEIMALQHQDFPVYGVQFHPESILSSQGHELLNNFITS